MLTFCTRRRAFDMSVCRKFDPVSKSYQQETRTTPAKPLSVGERIAMPRARNSATIRLSMFEM